MPIVQAKVDGGVSNVHFETSPNNCPFCHKSVSPLPLMGYVNDNKVSLEVFFHCPDLDCLSTFIGYYIRHGITKDQKRNYRFLGKCSIGNLLEKTFSLIIAERFVNFTKIFSEAYEAEQNNLLEICGGGYRKAIEFLIKEYCISLYPEKKATIERMLLAQVIDKYVDEAKIRNVAKRAVWLGNDETHYVRKWEGKDLTDLKKLIDVTLHWIEMDVLTKSFELEMPD